MSTPLVGIDRDDAPEPKVDADQRKAAHEELDRWLNGCEVEAPLYYDTGCSGELGSFTVHAYVGSDGELRLTQAQRMERSL